jgi:hypothetical protein
MKSWSSIGYVLLLATLLLQSSGLCALLAAQTPQNAHPCCPAHHSQSSHLAPHCCLISGTPVRPEAAGMELVDFWAMVPVIVAVAHSEPLAEPAAVHNILLLSPPLYLSFHQLLI